MPMTAHFIGGCAIGDSPETGVVDPYQRVYGHPGLHVVDGSAVSANLGVNPSLTITAQAERAMAFWPNKGEADPRPPLGSAYERVGPVRPSVPGRPADRAGRPAAAAGGHHVRLPISSSHARNHALEASLDVRVRSCAPSLAGPCRGGLCSDSARRARPTLPPRPGPVYLCASAALRRMAAADRAERPAAASSDPRDAAR